MTITGRLLAFTALASTMALSPAMAQDNDALLAQLKSMQAQMDRMQKEMNGLKQELAHTKSDAATTQKIALEAKAAKVAKAPEKKGDEVKITMVPAPKFETADGAYSFKVGGFAQLDAAMFNDDRHDHPDGTNIRRARLSASGTLAKDFKYKLENDFTSTTAGAGITDAYLEYAGFDPVSIMVGQFKEPFGLETLTSDLFTSFIERASTFAFSPDRSMGAQIGTRGEILSGGWTATLGGFGSNNSVASTDDEARDITGRLTFAPIANKTEVVHFGIAGSHRIPLAVNDSMRFNSKPESTVTNVNMLDTTVSNINDVDLMGLEAAGVYGPFSLQGEYVKANIDRKGGNIDEDFKGYYAEVSYFLTGESRNYVPATGRFDRVTPRWPLSISQGNWGAWQLAARYSDLDLNGKVVHGGEMKNTTFGIRWIPQANVAISANYIRVNTDQFATNADDDPNIFILRTQVDF
jgi:phosphate-selective porin OprO and OprP